MGERSLWPLEPIRGRNTRSDLGTLIWKSGAITPKLEKTSEAATAVTHQVHQIRPVTGPVNCGVTSQYQT